MKWLSEYFANPDYLLLLIIIPLLLAWYIIRLKKIHPKIIFSAFEAFEFTKSKLRTFLKHFAEILHLLAIAAIIIALARPQIPGTKRNVDIYGIDIVISLDISGSMLAEDLKPNRIEAAKKVAEEFIDKRPGDRIGLVAYSGIAFTQCPITIDHVVLKNLLRKLKNGMVIDGTAIGDGLGLAIERLKHSDAISKVIILLTDGINNSGYIDPALAANIARDYGIRVYTIGVGTYGKAPYPFITPFGKKYEMVDVEIDEKLLQNIAQVTGGKYFRATDNQSLQQIYNEIDQLEKSRIEVSYYTRYTEIFYIPLLIAFIFLSTKLILQYVFNRILP